MTNKHLIAGIVIPALVVLAVGLARSNALAQTISMRTSDLGLSARNVAAPSRRSEPLVRKDRINAWTIGLAAGRAEGAPLLLASELARVLDDGDEMRVLPVVTRGPFDNVEDLLYLRGVDAAIIYGDVLDHFREKPEFGPTINRINYLLNLFPSEVHVFARPEIHSLKDLAGKVVNFNTQGTAAAFSGPMVFRKLNIDVRSSFVPHSIALEKMRRGDEVAATIWVSSKPLAPLLKSKWPDGFHFLPIEYTEKLDYYTPAYLEASDYPDLIRNGERVATISVPAVLAVYGWKMGSERYRRLERLVNYLFDRFARLQTEPGYHEKWKDVNLAGAVPGWTRFPPLQKKLDAMASAAAPAITSRTDAPITSLAYRRSRSSELEHCCRAKAHRAVHQPAHARAIRHARSNRWKRRRANPVYGVSFEPLLF